MPHHPAQRAAHQRQSFAKYDRAYFDKWYRRPQWRIDTDASLRRKVRVAVSAAEYLLGRPIASVLDVACGEGRWFPVLRTIRPDVRYVGVDASDYVVRRFGKRRHIVKGTFGALRALAFGAASFDLVVCADALQYVATPDLAPGLREIRRLARGIAYIEAFTREDNMEGDTEGWHVRPAAEYRRAFRRAGLSHVGLHCWIDKRKFDNLNVFEIAS